MFVFLWLSRFPTHAHIQRPDAEKRRLRVHVEGRETFSVLDQAHGKSAVVLLVRHRVGVFQHGVRGHRTPQSTGLHYEIRL